MNRTFSAPITPARARLIALMAKHTQFEVDEALLARCDDGRIPDFKFDELSIYAPDDRAAVQFILDTNFRCGMPTPAREKARAERIIKAAISIAELPEEDVIVIDTPTSSFVKDSQFLCDFDFEALLPLRRKYLFMNLDKIDVKQLSMDMIGKMFPRLVLTGSMMIQYSFSFGANDATTCKMGKTLYPQVQASLEKAKWKNNQRRSVVAMGVFPDLLNDADDVPKMMAQAFCVPKTVEY